MAQKTCRPSLTPQSMTWVEAKIRYDDETTKEVLEDSLRRV